MLLAYFKRFITVGVLAATVFPCALAQQYIQPVSVIPGQTFQLGNVTYVPATSAQTVVPVQQILAQPAHVPTPTVVPTPVVTLEGHANKPSFSAEIAGSYNFATERIYTTNSDSGPRVNTTGIDLTFLYHINPKNAITSRVGYSFGSDDETIREAGLHYTGCNLDFDVSNLYFMPGYRGSTNISDSVFYFWGVNIGIASEHVEATVTIPGYGSGSVSDSKVGFAYSVEVGTNISLSPNAGIVIAAGLSGSTAEPSKNEAETNQQILNPGLRLGIRMGF